MTLQTFPFLFEFVEGVREAEEHDEGPEQPGSDTDYFLSK